MPPKKKRKQTSGGKSAPQYMWLLKYEGGGGYRELVTGEVLYSTKEKAIAGLPDLMDTHSHWGDDWKNGLEGFGKEDGDPYLGFEYLGDNVGDEGGEILTNKDADGGETVTVSLKRMQVDPPKIEKEDEGLVASDFLQF